MKTNVIAKLEIEGLHNWPDAESVFPEVGFLANMHRHKWFITAKKEVHHDDRDVEFKCNYVSVFEDNENGAEIFI